MSTITIRHLNGNFFEVTVTDHGTTTHTVTVEPAYAERLTQGKANTEQLVARSFDFLLARESNTSILRSFDLTVISHYFPEYERKIVKMLG
jgi:hypothetical protein